MNGRKNRRTDRGSAAVELLLLAPVLLVAAMLLVLAGRCVGAQLGLDAAAHAAARAASLHTSAPQARAAAHQMVGDVLEGYGLACQTYRLDVDTAALEPGGQVRAEVTCTLATSDLAALGATGTRQLSAEAVSAVDPYRQAQ